MKKITVLLILMMALLSLNFAFAAEQPDMGVKVGDINVGETAHVSITLPGDAQGKVVVSVNGHDYQSKVVNGKASVEISGLSAGDYNVKVKYAGEGEYLEVTKNVNLKVIDNTPAADESIDNTEVANASGEPDTTQLNASGEPDNATQINTTEITNTTNNTNTTNTTNVTNNTEPAKKVDNSTSPVKKPKEPAKPKTTIKDKNTGIPVLLLVLVAIGVVLGSVRRK